LRFRRLFQEPVRGCLEQSAGRFGVVGVSGQGLHRRPVGDDAGGVAVAQAAEQAAVEVVERAVDKPVAGVSGRRRSQLLQVPGVAEAGRAASGEGCQVVGGQELAQQVAQEIGELMKGAAHRHRDHVERAQLVRPRGADRLQGRLAQRPQQIAVPHQPVQEVALLVPPVVILLEAELGQDLPGAAVAGRDGEEPAGRLDGVRVGLAEVPGVAEQQVLQQPRHHREVPVPAQRVGGELRRGQHVLPVPDVAEFDAAAGQRREQLLVQGRPPGAGLGAPPVQRVVAAEDPHHLGLQRRLVDAHRDHHPGHHRTLRRRGAPLEASALVQVDHPLVHASISSVKSGFS